MAVYVFSDVHGHARALERALERISPSSDDLLICLGDMVDRGPDSVDVLRICHSLEGAVVLMGNHESMMLECLVADEEISWINWYVNGGEATARSLAALPEDELEELMGWVSKLPLTARCRVGERDYLLVHAGIRPGTYEVPETWDDAALDAVLASQTEEDLLWIREEFLGAPTGLVDGDGVGPVVVAGHTPTLMVERLADRAEETATYGGELRIMHLGACEATGGVADRIIVDCGAGSAPGGGRVAVLRLDDGECFYESLRPGE